MLEIPPFCNRISKDDFGPGWIYCSSLEELSERFLPVGMDEILLMEHSGIVLLDNKRIPKYIFIKGCPARLVQFAHLE
jgi:hypothetical protein